MGKDREVKRAVRKAAISSWLLGISLGTVYAIIAASYFKGHCVVGEISIRPLAKVQLDNDV
jgi:hypothetical protein